MTDIIKTEANKETSDQLKRYIEGIENYEAEKQEVLERLKEVFDEVKSAGFDVKTIKTIVKMRKMDKEKLDEQEYLLETYKDALGMS